MKRIVRKAVCVLLSAAMTIGILTSTVSAAKISSKSMNAARRPESIAADLVSYVGKAAAKPGPLVPKNTALTSFDGFAEAGEVAFSLDYAPTGADVRAEVTLRYDLNHSRYAADLVITVADRAPFTAQLYADGERLTVRCDELLGSGKVYGLKLEEPDIMLKRFSESALAEVLGVQPEVMAELTEALAGPTVRTETVSFGEKFAAYLAALSDYKAFIERSDTKLLADAKKNVTEQTLSLCKCENGQRDVYSAEAVLDDESVSAFLAEFKDVYVKYMRAAAALTGAPTEEINAMSEKLDLIFPAFYANGSTTYHFDQTTMELVKTDADITVGATLSDRTAEIRFVIAETVTDRYDATVAISTVLPDNEKETYEVAFGAGLDEKYKYFVWDGYLKFDDTTLYPTFTYDESKENYRLDIAVPMPPVGGQIYKSHVTAVGDLAVSEKAFAFTLNEISTRIPPMEITAFNAETKQEETFSQEEIVSPIHLPKLSFSYRALDEVAPQKSYKDLFALTEEEAYALAARATMKGQKLAESLNELTYGDYSNPRVKKLYAVTHADYENYAHLYSEEEFYDMVSEYTYYIDTHSSY